MKELEYVDDLVSVIIPVFNAEKYIDRTLQSIFFQSYKKIEIVIIDDCSTDHSAKIIKNYLPNHSEIIYHLQEKNMGAAVARNTALELASGRYVAFLDSDDIWKQDKTKRQICMMQEMKTSFSYTAIEMIDETGNIIKSKRNVREKIDYNILLHNTMIATSSVVIDRKKLGDFRMPLRRSGQDYATWLKLLRDGTVAYGINDALVQYRVSSNSLSSNKLKSIQQVWEIQTKDEGIGYFFAGVHTICFIINALLKYFF